MRRNVKILDLDDVDADGICASQTPAGAGALTLNGALGTSLDYARQLGVYSGSDINARVFTIVGTGANGEAVTETVTGVNNSTVETVNYYKTVTSISVDAGTGAAVIVGTVDEAASKLIPVDPYDEISPTVTIIATGTINYTVQECFDDILADGPSAANYLSITALASKTSSLSAPITAHASGVRVIVNSHSSGAALTMIISPSRDS